MEDEQKVPSRYHEGKGLAEVLEDLGYIAERAPGRPGCVGVKLILTKGRRVEDFRGNARQVWAWIRQCQACNRAGYVDDCCTDCDGTGLRPYFQQQIEDVRGAA